MLSDALAEIVTIVLFATVDPLRGEVIEAVGAIVSDEGVGVGVSVGVGVGVGEGTRVGIGVEVEVGLGVTKGARVGVGVEVGRTEEQSTALYALILPPAIGKEPLLSVFDSMQFRTSSLRKPLPLVSDTVVNTKAASPATWGDAMEVPLRLPYTFPGRVE